MKLKFRPEVPAIHALSLCWKPRVSPKLSLMCGFAENAYDSRPVITMISARVGSGCPGASSFDRYRVSSWALFHDGNVPVNSAACAGSDHVEGAVASR